MTKFNAEKYEQFLEDKNTISSGELVESYDNEGLPEIAQRL